MLKIGVQTKGMIGLEDDDPWEGFQKIHDAGFDRVDFSLDAFLPDGDICSGEIHSFFDREIWEIADYFAEYKKAMDYYNIKASQMHAPYPVRVQQNPEVTYYMQTQVIPKSIVVAEVLKTPWTVIHPFKLQYTHGREYERKENMEYFQRLIPLMKRCNVKICFENLYESIGGRIVEGVCADPEDAIWYVDTLNNAAGEELFGMCLDIGHLQLAKKDCYDYIIRLGSRIKALHLNENDGVSDLHGMPFTFGTGKERSLDWEAVIRGLRDIDYQGTLSFEPFSCMNAFPYGMKEDVLRTIHDIGEYYAERIEGK